MTSTVEPPIPIPRADCSGLRARAGGLAPVAYARSSEAPSLVGGPGSTDQATVGDDGVGWIEESTDGAFDDPPSASEPFPVVLGLAGYQFRFRPALCNHPIS
ncbi:hypothetical protein [Streptomyces sp. NPDC004728]|uniref:hypothetical protein n=1 Tax=Streptomyces sp. NPDC004728 TaxID=3154289 RepID=UPI0033A86327